MNPYVSVAKFQVNSVKHEGYRKDDKPYTQAIIITASPVYASSGDETNENWKFTQASPQGSFELRIENPDLFDSFYVGQQFYLPMIDADRATLASVSLALQDLPAKETRTGMDEK